jgi:hypothetical protein
VPNGYKPSFPLMRHVSLSWRAFLFRTVAPGQVAVTVPVKPIKRQREPVEAVTASLDFIIKA